ncbi:MAG: hypothetical protein LH631_13320 [Alkalinema sp. CAN_BIN05]|nr:hypothetical protein [Alkalinema sp. CAN_BIN05]
MTTLLSNTSPSTLPNTMNPLRLRQIWTLVESSQASLLVRLDDPGLEQWLMRQFSKDQTLSPSESQAMTHYVHNKLPLIREMAEQKVPTLV